MSLLLFYSGPIPQTGKVRLQNQQAALLLGRGRAETWTPRQKSLSWVASCLLKTQVQPPSGTHSRDPSYFGKSSLTGRSPLAPETLCCPCNLPVGPTTSLQALDSQLPPWGPPSRPGPICPLRAPKAAPSLAPFCTGKTSWVRLEGHLLLWAWRRWGADVNPRLTHCIPHPLWPGSIPRNLSSLFPRAPLRVPLSLPWGPVDSLQLLLVAVVMCSGCLNKAPRSGSFKHQITSSHFWRVKVWDQGVNPGFFGGLQMAVLLLCPYVVFPPTWSEHLPQVSPQTHDWPLLPHVSHPKAVGLPPHVASGCLLQSVPRYVSHPKAVGLPPRVASGCLLQSVPRYSAVTQWSLSLFWTLEERLRTKNVHCNLHQSLSPWHFSHPPNWWI